MTFDAVSATLAAGLGGSFLTGAAGIGIAAVTARSSRRGARDEARRDAYSRLVAATAPVAQTAWAIHHTMAVRSGLREGADVALHVRTAMDPLQLNAELRKDFEPVSQAWSAVWTVGTQEAVRAANDLVVSCGEVMGSATVRGGARTTFMRFLAGEKWTTEQLDRWEEASKELGRCRRVLAEIARRELGYEMADLTAGAASLRGTV